MKNQNLSLIVAALLGIGFALPLSAQEGSTDSPATHARMKKHKKKKVTPGNSEDATKSSNLSDSGATPTSPPSRPSDARQPTGSKVESRSERAAKRKTAPTPKAGDSGNLSDSGANPAGPTLRKSDASPLGQGQATGPAAPVSPAPASPSDSSNLRDSGANPGGSSSQTEPRPTSTPSR